MSIGTVLKRCGLCQQEKSRAEFYRCDSSNDGRQTRCKMCQKAHNNGALPEPRRRRRYVPLSAAEQEADSEAKTMAAFDILAAQTAAALG